MDIKKQILELIQDKPKHYTVIIRSNEQMMSWINSNAQTTSDHLPTKIYSAVHNVSTVCEYGNDRAVSRFNSGLVMCGPAKYCACTRKAISEGVSSTKQSYDTQKKQDIEDRRVNTMMNKYGVAYNSQRPEVKELLSLPKIPDNIHQKLSDYNYLHQEYIINQRSTVDIASELGVYYSTVVSYCVSHGFQIRRRSNYSMIEVEIGKFLTEQGIVFESGNYSVLGNKELDIYVPTHKFAIEVNGLYWHSYNPSQVEKENTNRHLSKTLMAKEKGVDVFHVTDWEWINKRDIIKSMLLNRLSKTPNKIYARHCKVKYLTTTEAKTFFEINHLQGHVNSKMYLGLVHNGDLVMVISLGHSRFDKNEKSIELHRLCSKLNTVVVGGASKLFNYLKNTVESMTRIVTYCDMSKSQGNTYRSLGFELVGEASPGYFYTDGTEVISRYKAMKQNLKSWLKSYDSQLSESQNMFNAGYRRYWDCGQLKFVMDVMNHNSI